MSNKKILFSTFPKGYENVFAQMELGEFFVFGAFCGNKNTVYYASTWTYMYIHVNTRTCTCIRNLSTAVGVGSLDVSDQTWRQDSNCSLQEYGKQRRNIGSKVTCYRPLLC